MDADTKSLLSQVMIGLGALAGAYDRLLDLEVVAHACQLADRMEAAIGGILQNLQTREDVDLVRRSVAELQEIVQEREAPAPRKDEIRRLARARWEWARVQIDEDAHVVERDDGAYIDARVWVSFDGTQLGRRSG